MEECLEGVGRVRLAEERVEVASSESVGAFIGPVSAFSPSDINHSVHQRERSRSPTGITDAVCLAFRRTCR